MSVSRKLANIEDGVRLEPGTQLQYIASDCYAKYHPLFLFGMAFVLTMGLQVLGDHDLLVQKNIFSKCTHVYTCVILTKAQMWPCVCVLGNREGSIAPSHHVTKHVSLGVHCLPLQAQKLILTSIPHISSRSKDWWNEALRKPCIGDLGRQGTSGQRGAERLPAASALQPHTTQAPLRSVPIQYGSRLYTPIRLHAPAPSLTSHPSPTRSHDNHTGAAHPVETP